ncbi:MAG: hypothetical protein ACLQJR_09895 [Stellaceae bacterium]
MALEATSGPELVWGQLPPTVAGNPPPDYNPDRAPSGGDLGWGVIDPRYGYKIGGWMNPSGQIGGAQANPLAILFLSASEMVGVDAAPSAVSTSNIAAAQNATSGTPMTLVSSSGAGITVMASALTIPQTGLVVPSGNLAIDGLPGLVPFGQSGAVALVDPTKNIARAVSVTGTTGAAGGQFNVVGFDLYGQPQTENITASAGATTTNGRKGWKFITSVTPQFTDAHNYSIGDADIYEFPIAVSEFPMATVGWANAIIAASTGFTAADPTSPATSITGSVRGTYATQSASNGTTKLQMFVSPQVASLAAITSTSFAGLFGVTPA